VALLHLAGAPLARAQEGEVDRKPLPERAHETDPPPPTPPERAPDTSGRPVSPAGDPRYIPEVPRFDPNELPTAPPPPAPPPSFLDQIVLRPELRFRAGGGWDSNVFRAERGRREDGFTRYRGEAKLTATLPTGTELFVDLTGEGIFYFEQHKANEYFGTSFIEVFQPVTRWLDVGLQNAFGASRQNLLDDNGDLFPRGRFGSYEEELRLYSILRPSTDLSFEVGGAPRWKDYEENSGVESLDYEELRADAAITWRVSRQPRTRLKLKYRFRRRDYRELSARERDGTVAVFAPSLDLHRHQVNLTLFQDVRPAGLELRLVAIGGFTYNRDLHRNDRSYRELSGSARAEVWLVPKKTRLDLAVRGVARDFLVRRPSTSSGLLRHRLIDGTVGIWQQLHGPLGVWADATAALWRSGDPLEGYERFILQAGLELSW
jgi:hypothetical protein